MTQVKAYQQSFKDFQTLYERLEEQLQIIVVTSERVRDNTLLALQQSLREAQDKLDAAERAYNDCMSEEERNCETEQAEYYEARQRVDELETALRHFEGEVEQFESILRLAWLLLETDIPKAKAHFAEVLRILGNLSTLGSVNTSTLSATDTHATGGRSSVTNPSTIQSGATNSQVGWVDKGIVYVDVDSLPEPEGITNDADFQKVSSSDMREGIARLQEMEITMKQGRGTNGEYWSEIDTQKGLSYEHGYRRVYDAFFGDSAIKLTKAGTTYDITNGRHRIWLAKRMGVKSLPARITEKS